MADIFEIHNDADDPATVADWLSFEVYDSLRNSAVD